MALFSAIHISVAINTNCEIEINITIHAPALLSMCQNSYYYIIFIVNFISLLFAVTAAMLVPSRMIFTRFSIVAPILLKYYNYTHAGT